MSENNTGPKEEFLLQIKGLGVIAIAVFCYFSLAYTDEAGILGDFISRVLRTVAGDTALLIPFLLGLLALKLMLPSRVLDLKTRLTGIALLYLAFIIFYQFYYLFDVFPPVLPAEPVDFSGNDYLRLLREGVTGEQGGGLVGVLFFVVLHNFINTIGSYILLITLTVVSLLFISNVSVSQIFGLIRKVILRILEFIKAAGRFFKELYMVLIAGVEEEEREEEKNGGNGQEKADELIPGSYGGPGSEPAAAGVSRTENDENRNALSREASGYQGERTIDFKNYNASSEDTGVADNGSGEISGTGSSTGEVMLPQEYALPPLSLLSKPSGNYQQEEKNIQNRARLLENTLNSFGVKAKVVNVHAGPTVTRFEVQPETGVKVSKIINLSDDIALNLAAPDIRIEAPIPGKAALGIEVPNKVISLIYLREVLEDPSFRNHGSPLSIAVGKDITGIPVVTSLEKMPHLLIAGATGSGKSVCLNTLITSILFKAMPHEVKFLMIDPKMVELGIFNGIPHLLTPVVMDPKKASAALKNMIKEMNKRYDLFAREGVRDITSYNEKVKNGELEGEILPFIIIIVDELADLMLVSPGEVEDSIARLAQMSRAAGIHLVIATQRPSVDVITGIIKANIPSRIAFTVSSQVDSRTILDMAGAEKLLGKGDMLYYPVGAVKPMRVQGAFLGENDLKAVIDFVKEQGEDSNQEEDLVTVEEGEGESWNEVDELFPEAVELILRTGQASVSLLQRRFRIGYTRAARLMDDLEKKGVVGRHEGSKPREIIISPEQASKLYDEFKEDNN